MPRKRRSYGRSYGRRKGYSKRRKTTARISYAALAKAMAKLNEFKTIAKGDPGSAPSLQHWGANPRDLWFQMQYGPKATREAAYQQMVNRRTSNYWGPGDYRKYGKFLPRVGGAIAGGYSGWNSGGAAGMFEGAKVGWKKGASASRFLGMGDYSANQIISDSPLSAQQGVMHSVGVTDDLTGDLVYSNNEFIGNVYATCPGGSQTSPFEIRKYIVNPGMQETLPFFSQLAINFELYEPLGIIFQYKPTSGEFGNNTSNSLGKVIMATNYDPDASAFSNSVVMENYDYANSTKPSEGAIHGVECAPTARSTRMLYVRNGDTSKNKIFTDIGNFYLATEGIPFGASSEERSALIGELWVTYSFRLSRSKLYQTLGDGTLWYAQTTASQNGQTNLLDATVVPGSTLDIEIVDAGGGDYRIVFPSTSVPKRWIVGFYNRTSTTAATPVGIDDGQNITLFRSLNGTGGGGLNKVMSEIFDQLPGNGQSYITFSQPFVAGVDMTSKLWITEVDKDFDNGGIVTP